MHIDHSKLVELLAEAADITEQKAEEQLAKLVQSIQEAFADGDASEVDGLGVFSKMGSNVIFIPADDFATEINYKYVGMEPIELDKPSRKPQPPATTEGITTGSDEQDDDEPLEDKQPDDISEFADEMAEETPSDSVDEELDEDIEEELTEPADDESADSILSGMLGKKSDKGGFSLDDDNDAEKDEESLEEEVEDVLSDVEEEDIPDEDTLSVFLGDEATEEEEPEDPFEALAGELDEDENDEDEEDDDSASKKPSDTEQPKEQKPTETKEPAPAATPSVPESAKQEKEKKSTEKQKPAPAFRRPSTPRKPKRQPVLLWLLLAIAILAGGTYGLGYLGVFNISGITPKPQMTATQSPSEAEMPSAQPENEQPAEPETVPEENELESTESELPSTSQSDELSGEEQAASPEVKKEEVSSAGQPKYGLTGAINREANDGYTIVVFSLSNKESAQTKIEELTAEGYRALLVSVPSAQYEQLWRVSVGQFKTTQAAALSADSLKAPYANNYFITKIY